MKRTVAAVVAILGLYWITAPGWTIGEPDLPTGVTPDNWIEISEDVGLVVELKEEMPWPVGSNIKPHPRAEAVLMAKVQGQWTVIDWPTEPKGYEFKPLE